MITAEILSIGDEVLIGQTINTNAAYMGEHLSLAGVVVKQVLTIADEEQAILDALEKSKCDIVLLTGGLGPTKDDITKKTLCKHFNTPLVMNEEVLERIEGYFKSRGREMLEVNRDQALMPASCTVLKNDVGTASGMWFEENGRVFVSMPGVPYEMRFLMETHVIPMMNALFKPDVIVHKTILTTGIGESFLAEIVEDWENSLAKENIGLAYLPSPGLVKLRLTAKGEDEVALRAMVEKKAEAFKQLAGKYIFGYEKEKLQGAVGRLLLENKATVSTAESCTGGYLAHLITSVSGSSSYYWGSIVAYDNAVKKAQLHVTEADLKNHGAVSQQVVEQMARGVRERLGTTYAISTSGVAGPDGGTEEKPVGTVWIAVAGPKGVFSKKFSFGDHRGRNIRRAALAGLNMLRLKMDDI